MMTKAGVDATAIEAAAEHRARRRRSCDADDVVFDPLRGLELLERKESVLDHAAPLRGRVGKTT